MSIKQKPISKKGIFFTLNQYPTMQFESGVISRERMNSCFFCVKCHIKSNDSDYYQSLNNFTYELKSKLNKFIPKSSFKFNYITTPMIPMNYIETGNSFVNFEFTLFPKTTMNLEKAESEMNELASMMSEVTENIDYITFLKKKIYAKK